MENNLNTMIVSAMNSNPVEFAKATTAELNSRLSDAIADRRTEVVSSMFSTPAGENTDNG